MSGSAFDPASSAYGEDVRTAAGHKRRKEETMSDTLEQPSELVEVTSTTSTAGAPQTKPTERDERAAFEAWHLATYHYDSHTPGYLPFSDWLKTFNARWEGWQARAKEGTS
jgi:hypothetical protein